MNTIFVTRVIQIMLTLQTDLSYLEGDAGTEVQGNLLVEGLMEIF